MTTSLVTGGAGFIGSHIVDALVARGDNVRVVDNLSSGHLENLTQVMDQIDFIEGDIRDEATLERATTGTDYIFHLAAMVSVPESMEKPLEAELINAVGTLKLLQAAKAAGTHRLVLSSTCAVYGDEPTLPKTEPMSTHPKSPYAISKLTAEAYCQLFTEAYRQEAAILRYFNVFGPRQDPSSPYSGVISIFVDRLARGIAPFIFGDGEQSRDFVFVQDVVRANLLAASTKEAAGKVFNIGAGRQVSINDLFAILRDIFELDVEPHYKEARGGDILHSYSDPALAAEVLGWQAQISFEEGLDRLVESVRTTA